MIPGEARSVCPGKGVVLSVQLYSTVDTNPGSRGARTGPWD